jgi:hypothetical protein
VSLSRGDSYGAGDLYLSTHQFGLEHQTRRRPLPGMDCFGPTGRYAPGANNNRGLGMWSHELALGSDRLL